MKKVFYVLAVLLIAILAYTFWGNDTQVAAPKDVESNFVKQIADSRKQKDELFRTTEDSPIENKEEFKGLKYFRPDSSYRIIATILPYNDADNEASIPMSNGEPEKYKKYGYAQFTLSGITHKLLIHQHEHGLSLMFRDATAPKETYGGGRYLDFKENEVQNGQLLIDFNLAYNPYCVYNHTYSCPVPPAENTLSIRIEAGEKNP